MHRMETFSPNSVSMEPPNIIRRLLVIDGAGVGLLTAFGSNTGGSKGGSLFRDKGRVITKRRK
jgi:hypothetical protein